MSFVTVLRHQPVDNMCVKKQHQLDSEDRPTTQVIAIISWLVSEVGKTEPCSAGLLLASVDSKGSC